jgi:hypothetical protein
MLYYRDEQTGEHLVTHNGQERRFPTRAAAISACRELRDEQPDEHGAESARATG